MLGLIHLVILSVLGLSLAAPQIVLSPSGVTASSAAAAGKTFDYIVVGGGLAGITVAARLAENPAFSILVVEAGSDNRNDPRVFDIYNYGQAFGSDLDWNWPADQGKHIAGCVRSIDDSAGLNSTIQR
jgi:hypothetical protein